MRFMVMVRANEITEAGALPTEEELAAMGRFNEELAQAGLLLGGEGLHPSARGARVRFTNGTPTVIDGPFAETKELIAGFWLLQADSKEEVIEWMKRCPSPSEGVFELEIRQVFEDDDFGEAFTPELREAEQRLRAQISQQPPQQS